MNTTTPNPWSNLVINNSYCCCEEDEQYIKHLLSIPKYQKELKAAALPDPFNGNPDAPVYVLNGNPGFHPDDLLFAADPNFLQLTVENLNHRCPKIIYLDNISSSGIIHPGCKWWQDRTKKMAQKENLFNVELFPYHSENFLSNLIFPSFKYTRELVLDAMNQKKPIILRGNFQICWFSAVPELLTYTGELYITNTPRTIRFPENKIKDYTQMHSYLF